MVGSNDDWAFSWHVAKTSDLGAKCEHQERGEERSQSSVGQIVQHGPNLVVIDGCDTI